MAQHYKQGCIDVIQLDERLTGDDVAAIHPTLETLVQDRLPQIVADVRRVRLIDSKGLEFLVEHQQACLARGGTLRLAGPGLILREVFRITGLDKQLPIHADVISAVGAFAQ